MIEIPQEHIEAWRKARGTRETLPSRLADAFVWALAGWERERFEREHEIEHEDNGRGAFIVPVCLECGHQGKWDERHTWTDEQWQQAARAELEKAK